MNSKLLFTLVAMTSVSSYVKADREITSYLPMNPDINIKLTKREKPYPQEELYDHYVYNDPDNGLTAFILTTILETCSKKDIVRNYINVPNTSFNTKGSLKKEDYTAKYNVSKSRDNIEIESIFEAEDAKSRSGVYSHTQQLDNAIIADSFVSLNEIGIVEDSCTKCRFFRYDTELQRPNADGNYEKSRFKSTFKCKTKINVETAQKIVAEKEKAKQNQATK